METKPVLRAESLAVKLAGHLIFQDLSFCLQAGQFVGLLGPNGAGKTTLLRAVQGLVPAEGKVDATGRIGYVPQRHEVAWDFPMTVREAVVSGRTGLRGWLRRPGRRDFRAADAALAHVGLADLAHRPIGELSGGQRQRVLIGRALATDPEILLLDEPFTGLDAPSTEALLDLFGNECTRGRTIVMSTHNLAEAVHVCSDIILFNRGIVAQGPAAEVRTEPQAWVETFHVSAASPLLSAIGVSA